jgi:hypothetical protein
LLNLALNTLSFQLYRPSDRPECLAIFSEHLGTYFAMGESTEFDAFLDSVEDPTDPEGTRFWVAIEEDRIVAFGGVHVEQNSASLCWGVVRKSHLGRRIGDKLILHRLAWLNTEHPEVESVTCNTAPKTETFFAKYGFKTYRRQPNYWGGELELVAMKLSLIKSP